MKAFVILAAVMAVAVANPLPLVQIIVNVDAPSSNPPPVDNVIAPPVIEDPSPVPSLPIFIPKPIIVRPPVLPIIPGPALVPEPAPPVIVPEPVLLPEPVLPVPAPEPVVLPEAVLPVAVPEPEALPEPVNPEGPQVLPHLVAPAVIKT